MLFLLAFGSGIWLAGQQIENARWVASGVPLARKWAGTTDMRIGLIAGHSGNDSGAICPDGLREVDITEDVAQRLARRLRRHGFQVDVLQEFDERLFAYRADVLLSIHVDSCIDATGFKLARSASSAIPVREDALIRCLYESYEQITGLPRHEETITHDMTEYHAFRTIHPQTPAAIIEIGFMGGDRELLTGDPERVAYALDEGLRCFLLPDEATPAP